MRVLASSCFMVAALSAGEVTIDVINPSKQAYEDAAIRLPVPLPAGLAAARSGAPIAIVATRDGKAVPTAMVEEDGAWWAVVRDSLAATSKATYVVKPGTGPAAGKPVTIKREGDAWVLDNGIIAVRAPASEAQLSAGPISGIRLGGQWVGSSTWSGMIPSGFTATVIADGQACAALRMRWTFAAKAGINGDVPAFADVVLRLDPGAAHVEVQERHTAPAGTRWNLLLAKGWTPQAGFSKPFWGGAGEDGSPKAPPPDRPLAPFEHPAKRTDLFLAILPRWNQHWKDGWRAGVGDGTHAISAVAVAASRWVWPHDNALELSVLDGGTLIAPAQRGRRVWWLFAGPTAQASAPDIAYLQRWCWQHPTRVGGWIGEWAGASGGFTNQNPYDGGAVNPTGGIRKMARGLLGKPPGDGDLTTLFKVQDWIHGDVYGTYWLGWSPENPNFFTDFSAPAVPWVAAIKKHPRAAELIKAIANRFEEDLYHSVTMPGGAGQECPGYMHDMLGSQQGFAVQGAYAAQHLGFDPRTSPRFKAGEAFNWRVSQPAGVGQRRMLPMGDTHPGADGPKKIDGDAAQISTWTSEEFPGFGAILRSKPGTADETYVAFKGGPNRGHYHGDQLSFHLCFSATASVVDHYCSYKPRAGQEHMHNRVSFSSSDLPYANMDGYERLIGFATHPSADIAVAQVESDRLRSVRDLPGEAWHGEWPQKRLAKPLIYRRTLVLLKGVANGKDALVVRDQWTGASGLKATYNLHTHGAPARFSGAVADFGQIVAHRIAPATVSEAPFAWQHPNGGGERSNGLRWSVDGDGEMLTVILPGGAKAEIAALADGVKINAVSVTFHKPFPELSREAGALVSVSAGPSLALTDVNLDRSQGDIGLFVPDAGYPFGSIPDWLIRQRWKLTPAAPEWAARLRDEQP